MFGQPEVEHSDFLTVIKVSIGVSAMSKINLLILVKSSQYQKYFKPLKFKQKTD